MTTDLLLFYLIIAVVVLTLVVLSLPTLINRSKRK